GVPSVQISLPKVVVELTPWLAPREIVVAGGEISLSGAADGVLEQLRGWRAQHSSGARATTSTGAHLALRGDGLTVRWTGLDGSTAVQSLTGIAFERGERQRMGFEHAHLELALGTLDLTDASVELRDGSEGTTLDAASVGQVVGRVVLGSAGAAGATASGSAAAAADDDAGGDEDADDSTPAAAPRRDPKRVLLPLLTDTWARRRARLADLRQTAERWFGDGAHIELARVQLELARGDSVLNVGPAPLSVQRKGMLISADFKPPASKDGKRLTVSGRLPLDDAPIELSLEGGPISLATLGVRENDFGLLGVDHSQLILATRVGLSPLGVLSVSASGRLRDLALSQAALAPDPLTDVDLSWQGQIQLDMSRRRLEIRDAQVAVKQARVELSGVLEANDDDLRVSLTLGVPPTPCQNLLEAAPVALLPQLEGLRLGGTFGLDSHVEFDTAAPKDTQVEWALHNACKVVEIPEAIDPEIFHEPFQHLVVDGDNEPTEVLSGPGTDAWVPFSEITPYMETALVVCEDSRFFSHHGFDDKAIRSSITDNLRAGHFVRGASTLSMQLAKNLYLSREKSLSRKLQEAVFTMLLEESLSKQEILELYLNVVEFGPGIYGIKDAAAHYFNTVPAQLSLAQAFYLGSILPNPKKNHFQKDGMLRQRWADKLQYLMRVAHKIHRISDEELAAGQNEQLSLGSANPSGSAPAPSDTPPILQLHDR
ncbi:MAG TPA: biosynthetic peptidoglycan transglycosylase, partial [Polyangiaceae bacterium]|nr:biosynthetic peptidoglycan transglycosylase [Polyangiaceae bacterium]